ncbi:GDP-mannose 4,6-dehydratase [Candidatus Woesearchaeota archaeon]|nr:GDP-mannose 4,6-dehydratase [Candidatus Woesearchaeota archaeon]
MSYRINRMDGEEVLILGGMGAVGSNLAHQAVSLGARVTIFDNFMEGTGANPANIKEIKDQLAIIRGDIRNLDALSQAVRGKSIIFNCAAQVNHILSMQNPFLDIDINCMGQINVLEACRRHNDAARIVYTGTRGQSGAALYSPIDEQHPDNPTDVYGADKLASEWYHLLYHKHYGIWTTSLRMTNTYGPRAQIIHPTYSIINWVIGKAILNQEITVFKPGTQLRDTNYMQDAVDALFLAAQNKSANGEMFVLGSGQGIPFIELVKLIISIAGTGTYKLVDWPADRRNIETGSVILNHGKIKAMLGWEPKTPLEEGIRKTIDFYRLNFNEYLQQPQ